MKPGPKFALKLGLALVGAFLVSEGLTRYVFYETAPTTRLSFRVWLNQKKQQVRTLPEKISLKNPFSRQPKLPPPVSFPGPRPIPPDPTPRPSRPPSSPKPKTTPTPKSPITPSPPPGSSPAPTPTPPVLPTATPRTTPTPTPTPTPPSSSPPPIENRAIALVEAINQERARQGLGRLSAPDLLMEVGQVYVKDLGKCGHGVPGKGYIWDYAKRAGYRGTGMCEVVACGASSPERAVSMWMGSKKGHRECILNSSGKFVGAGVWQGYWLAGVFK